MSNFETMNEQEFKQNIRIGVIRMLDELSIFFFHSHRLTVMCLEVGGEKYAIVECYIIICTRRYFRSHELTCMCLEVGRDKHTIVDCYMITCARRCLIESLVMMAYLVFQIPLYVAYRFKLGNYWEVKHIFSLKFLSICVP